MIDFSSRKSHLPSISRLMGLILLFGLWGQTLQAQTPNPDPNGTQNSSKQEKQGEQGEENRRDAIPKNPEEIIDALGYFFVAPFLLASVIALWFAFERLVVLRRSRVIPRPFVERFLQHLKEGQLDPVAALQLCDHNGSPVAQVFAHGVRKWGKPSVEVEQAIIDGGERQVSQLRKHLRVLNGVATITPLIGLLGTVIGMIQAFNQIATNADQQQTASDLAVGIALALLTTAAGLLIAIPSLIMYMYLAGKVDSLVIEMDHLAQSVVHMISSEALSSQAVRETGVGKDAPSGPKSKSTSTSSKSKEKV